MVLFDPFWCPWDEGYQKYSSDTGHIFIIRGTGDGSLFCMDAYYGHDAIELPEDIFYKGLRSIYFSSCKELPYVTEEQKKEELMDLYKSMLERDYFPMLQEYMADLADREELFAGIRQDDSFWIDPKVVFLMLVNQSIQNVARVTGYVAEQTDSEYLRRAQQKIWHLAVRWKQTRKLIIKLYFMKRRDEPLKEKAVRRMRDILDEFRMVVGNMAECGFTYADEEGQDAKGREEDHQNGRTGMPQCYMLDLQEYVNNKAFITPDEIQEGIMDADFSSVGTCYLWDARISDLETQDRILFHTCIGLRQKDNVACDGQEIRLTGVRQTGNGYCGIAIMGAAEFGDSTDILEIQYQDRKTYELEFQFTDYVCSPKYGETVVWQGHGMYKEADTLRKMDEDLYLFRQEYRIPAVNVNSVVLPLNPSIHIFAITFLYE